MNKKHILYILLIICIALGAFLLIKYCLDFQKRIIRNEILTTMRAVENKNINRTVRYLSPDFTYGGFDKETIKQELISFFEEFEKININISKIKIKIEEDRATVNFKLVVLVTYQGMTGPVIGKLTNPARVECIFIKNEEWLLEKITIYEAEQIVSAGFSLHKIIRTFYLHYET